MISEKFEKEIKNFKEDLFYNSSGNKNAYKLFVRHISYAPAMGIGIKIGDFFIPTKDVNIVDFENEKIIQTEDKIKIIPIKILT